jgi:hypothetical protein
MSYARDWDEAIPADHTKFKVQPGYVRDSKVDISDRLKNLVSGFIAGETEEGFKKIPLLVQTTAPTSDTDMIIGFGSDVSSKCEFFFIDEDDNVIQVTSGGKVKAGILGTKEIDETDIADGKYTKYDSASGKIVYDTPVGIPTGGIIMWSGTIANIPSGWYLCDGNNSTPDLRDKFIVGAKQDDGGIAKSNIEGSLKKSGGSVTISEANLPAHNHTIQLYNVGTGSQNYTVGGLNGGGGGIGTSNNTGGGAAYTQPYYALAFIMKS